jgi:hypothetical protein
MTERERDPTIAQPDEVLRVMTAILRGESMEEAGVKTAERYKAAELLGRHYGLFERREAPGADLQRVSREIGQMLAELAGAGNSAEAEQAGQAAKDSKDTENADGAEDES